MSLPSEYYIIALGKDPTHIGVLTGMIDPGHSKTGAIVTPNSTIYPDREMNERELAFTRFIGRKINIPINNAVLQGILTEENQPFIPEGERIRVREDSVKRFKDALEKRLIEEGDGKPVIINTYSNSEHSTRLRERGFIVLGPDYELVKRFSNKFEAYNLAKSLGIPVADGGIVNSKEEAYDLFSELSRNSAGGVFMTTEKGSGGKTAKHIESLEDIAEFEAQPPFLLTRWVDKVASPNSQALIAKDKVLYLGLTDQIILRNVEYFGNIFPSQTSEAAQEAIKNYTIKLAEFMGREGYRGISGFDWMVTRDGEVLFSEINPRKNRSTSMLVAYLEQTRPEGIPSIPELEAHASLDLPLDGFELWEPREGVYWGMRLFKTYGKAKITKGITPLFDDKAIFQYPGASSILNFPKKGTRLPAFKAYHDLARIIANGSSWDEVNELIEKERERIRGSYRKY